MGDNGPNHIRKNKFSKWKKKPTKNNGEKGPVTDELRKNRSLSPSQKINKLNICNIDRNLNIPYYGWKLFFYTEEYDENSRTVKNVKAFEDFVKRHQEILSHLSLAHLENGTALMLDMEILCNDEIFTNYWPEFRNDLQDKAIYALDCMKLAIHQIILNTVSESTLKNIRNHLSNLPMVRIKLINYGPIVPLHDLKVNCYGKLISTQGCIIRVSRQKHLAQWVVFACTRCGLEKVVKQQQGIYTVPRKCGVCGTVKLNPVLDSPYTRSIPFQMIRIQERLNDDQENKGRVPRFLEVELLDDLVNTCMPGDDVTITGIIKVQGADDATNNKVNAVNSFSLYMEAITIINIKNRCQNSCITDTELSLKDYFAIKEVYSEPNVFALLVHSLCPGIYGHEMIKAGLILSLFGGNARGADLRDDIHMLIVGDPGLGKSQMLQACARVAPKGVYVCGNSSTSSGLTVSLSKESGTSDFALEPGALVLADKGCCCIDEFDKMPTQHQALLEAMEQQSVSVAKSGVVCSIPARTSILAAANPIGGRYNRGKTMVENLNMSQPLLSRFDLVFLLLDTPNSQLDSLLCNHVMTFHTGTNGAAKMNDFMYARQKNVNLTKDSLREKLIRFSGQNVNAIPHSIMRKYISYAKQYVKPRLTPKSADVLQKYYLGLRSRNETSCGIPVYHRQLEAMIRLTEARAKLELRVETTEEDALEVVEILRFAMANAVPNDADLLLNLTNDSGKITEKKVKAFMKLLRREVKDDATKSFPTSELKEIASDGGIIIDDFSRFIAKLNEQGILLKSGRNVYKFVAD